MTEKEYAEDLVLDLKKEIKKEGKLLIAFTKQTIEETNMELLTKELKNLGYLLEFANIDDHMYHISKI